MKTKDDIISILLVDDHKLILEGYKNVLAKTDIEGVSLTLDTATDCDTAWKKLNTNTYQVVFLDINFPVNEDSRFLSGEDLGAAIRKKFPKVKIIIITFLEDPLRVHNLLIHINPAGFLLKGKADPKDLQLCIKKVLTSPPYYSHKIIQLIRLKLHDTAFIDEIDRKILYQLSQGTQTKDIPQYVHLSLRTVEDRKRKLKKLFGVSDKGNRALLAKARASGYI